MGKLEDPGMDEFEGLDLRNLQIDQAWLRIRSQLDRPTWLYVRSDDCYKVNYYFPTPQQLLSPHYNLLNESALGSK